MRTFDKELDPAGENFAEWREGRDDWFVINCKSANDWMIHIATCPHFDFDRRVNLAKHTKYCSTKRRELDALAEKEIGHLPTECKTCMRDKH